MLVTLETRTSFSSRFTWIQDMAMMLPTIPCRLQCDAAFLEKAETGVMEVNKIPSQALQFGFKKELQEKADSYHLHHSPQHVSPLPNSVMSPSS